MSDDMPYLKFHDLSGLPTNTLPLLKVDGGVRSKLRVTVNIPMLFPDAMERIAAEQHAIWAHWMSFLFSCSTSNPDGSVTIPAEKVERWQRQMETEYADLTAQEKESDRHQAKRVVDVMFVPDEVIPSDKGSYPREEVKPQ